MLSRYNDTFNGKVNISGEMAELKKALARGHAILNEALLVTLMCDKQLKEGDRRTHVQSTIDKLEKQETQLGTPIKALLHKAIMSQVARAALA